MSYAVGSLVRARGREWVVVPGSEDALLLVRPLGGGQDEISGIVTSLENVEPAVFDLPSPRDRSDFQSCRLLRDAVRLGFRSSAGPFRCFGSIAVEPRPYQLAPLLMALRQDTVRLLIADDVGVGKTIEAGLIASELLARGEVQKLAVLCLPQLAEQWKRELSEKFHIEAELVLSSTAAALERRCKLNESMFNRYPFVVVSTDFIKSERRLQEFLTHCPELVIVDEAHTCANPNTQRGSRHQRHTLLKRLAADKSRHLVLVTATPHSGNETAFRSLLELLDPRFKDLPEDLRGDENRSRREELARYIIQRRRADIARYLETNTPFPQRKTAEETYDLNAPFRSLIVDALAYAREVVQHERANTPTQRVRWWSALALLRCIASSPAAAQATLEQRARIADLADVAETERLARQTASDTLDEDTAAEADNQPTAITGDKLETGEAELTRLEQLLERVKQITPGNDNKLQRLKTIVTRLLKDGRNPIVFCRFMATAEYVYEELKRSVGANVYIDFITGVLPPSEREDRVEKFADDRQRLLVCTDCLSEGINLQSKFDAVVHYDLAWNPTRHEQREGRVDRFGQPRQDVQVVTLYGKDNPIDGLVMKVLLQKHETIRGSLGISVPVPQNGENMIEAIFEGLLLRGGTGASSHQLSLELDGILSCQSSDFDAEWQDAAAREKRSNTVFAQRNLPVEEVAGVLNQVRGALGAQDDTRRFMLQALRFYRAGISEKGGVNVELATCPIAVQEIFGKQTKVKLVFSPPVNRGETLVTRTSPQASQLASYVLDNALDFRDNESASRCGVMKTEAVTQRTTLLLVRFRFHIERVVAGDVKPPLLAEDAALLAFQGSPSRAVWLSPADAEALLEAEPKENIAADQAEHHLKNMMNGIRDSLQPALANAANEHAAMLHAHHEGVTTGRSLRIRTTVRPQLPPDIIGVYLYLPA